MQDDPNTNKIRFFSIASENTFYFYGPIHETTVALPDTALDNKTITWHALFHSASKNSSRCLLHLDGLL